MSCAVLCCTVGDLVQECLNKYDCNRGKWTHQDAVDNKWLGSLLVDVLGVYTH